MSSYNRVILLGNLTREPEIKNMPSGGTLAGLSLAVNRKYTAGGERKEETTYVDISFWGKMAEVFKKLSLRKGTPLLVEGRLHLDTWEDKASGQKRSKLKVVGETFQLVAPRSSGDGARGDDRGGQGRDNSDAEPVHDFSQGEDEPF